MASGKLRSPPPTKPVIWPVNNMPQNCHEAILETPLLMVHCSLASSANDSIHAAAASAAALAVQQPSSGPISCCVTQICGCVITVRVFPWPPASNLCAWNSKLARGECARYSARGVARGARGGCSSGACVLFALCLSRSAWGGHPSRVRGRGRGRGRLAAE